MTRHELVRCMFASAFFVASCADEDDGDDGGDEFVDEDGPADGPMDATGPVDTGVDDTTGGAACVAAGQPCVAGDLCNTWICTCNAGATEFMTVGSCSAGVCTADGTLACEPICNASGGVASAVDGGCG